MIADRIDLIAALTQGAQLEQAICCQYLFAAFSIKTRPEEGGVGWADIERAREWKTTLLLLARQEMEHLGSVADLLTAIGSAPHFLRPNFPFVNLHYGDVPIELRPLDQEVLERFICLERPAHISKPDAFCRAIQRVGRGAVGRRAAAHDTIGELYADIRSALRRLPGHKLFLGAPSAQVSDVTLGLPQQGFYDIRARPILDRASAIAVVDQIIEEGEGTAAGLDDPADLDHCHYGKLVALRGDYLDGARRAKRERRDFAPVRPMAWNPAADPPADGNPVTVVTNERTREVMRLFDFGYETLVMFLICVYSHRDETRHGFQAVRTAAFWPLMTMFVRPVGELLAELPADGERDAPRAGPSFRLSPGLHLLPDPKAAACLLDERLQRLAADTSRLVRRHRQWFPAHWRTRSERLALDMAGVARNFAEQARVDA